MFQRCSCVTSNGVVFVLCSVEKFFGKMELFPVPALHHGGRKCMASVAWWRPPPPPPAYPQTRLPHLEEGHGQEEVPCRTGGASGLGSSPPRAPYAAPWPSRRVAAAWTAACGRGRRRERRSGVHIASARAGRRRSLPLIAVQEARLAPWKSRGLFHDPSNVSAPSPAPRPGPRPGTELTAHENALLRGTSGKLSVS